MRRIQIETETQVYDIPAKWAICSRCRGEGHHGNPAFDGLSLQDETFEDPEFREDYFKGVYDVRCETCGGSGKVLEPDRESCSIEEIRAWEQEQRELAEIARAERLDARMGW